MLKVVFDRGGNCFWPIDRGRHLMFLRTAVIGSSLCRLSLSAKCPIPRIRQTVKDSHFGDVVSYVCNIFPVKPSIPASQSVFSPALRTQILLCAFFDLLFTTRAGKEIKIEAPSPELNKYKRRHGFSI